MTDMQDGTVKILYIEDDAGLARLFQKKMLAAGYSVDLAADGREGLSMYAAGKFDLVATDYMVPEIDGLGVLRTIVKEENHSPVVMVTGTGSEEVAVEALKLGAADYIIKDVDGNYLELLPALVHKVLQNEMVVEERRHAEREAAMLRSYLQNVIDSMPSIIVGVDSDLRITQWNVRAETATGTLLAEARGRPVHELFPQLRDRVDIMKSVFKSGNASSRERIAVPVQGKMRHYDMMVYPLSGDERGAVIRIEDVTRLVRVEEMMVHAEKMRCVLGLAAGISHEINNPLSGVVLGTQNVLRRLSPSLCQNREIAVECGVELDDVWRYLDRRGIVQMMEGINSMGQRAGEIIDYMLKFSRGGEGAAREVDLRALVERCLEMASHDYELMNRCNFSVIETVKEYQENMPGVICAEAELEHVLFNLIKNAGQSLRHVEAPRLSLEVRGDGSDALIVVEDNGPGMDEETRQRIFEPFYSRRAHGEGMGLGLSVCYIIVSQMHGGEITVDSAPGKGSRFTVKIPLCAA
ncbi:MAG TPA: ATP-binding protein [Spirochaetota bacterium]|nr:ATP-binding protein [Spirochaetota bacterium]